MISAWTHRRRSQAPGLLPVWSLAILVGAAAALSACAGPTTRTDPTARHVCGRAVSLSEVADLLPRTRLNVREEQTPERRYPVLRCEVTAEGGQSFIASAYLFNMAGAELVQLAGDTTSSAASIPDGMAGPDDAWMIRPCLIQIDPPPKPLTDLPLLIRVRLTGLGQPTDHRRQLTGLLSQVASGVDKYAACGHPMPDKPLIPAPAPARRPVNEAWVCDVVDPRALGVSAQGDARTRWSAARTPGTGAYVETCDVFLDDQRRYSFYAVHGHLVPFTERPGNRPTLTQRLDLPPEGARLPDPNAPAARVRGDVVAAVDAKCGDIDIAYRLSKYREPASALPVKNLSLESAFRGYVRRMSRQRGCEPIPDSADWSFSPVG